LSVFPPKRKKTAFSLGAYVTNKLTGDKVPVWIADYVLVGYGTVP